MAARDEATIGTIGGGQHVPVGGGLARRRVIAVTAVARHGASEAALERVEDI